MKAGGSIQWTLLKRYSEMDDFEGNVIVVAVPDEENMSAGMRGAVRLLAELKDKYDLDYRMMIYSEPQQRKSVETLSVCLGLVERYSLRKSTEPQTVFALLPRNWRNTRSCAPI